MSSVLGEKKHSHWKAAYLTATFLLDMSQEELIQSALFLVVLPVRAVCSEFSSTSIFEKGKESMGEIMKRH